jgi:hypothetical protein
MYRYVAGIEADENSPGFKHFILRPLADTRDVLQNERITRAEAVFASYYGAIKSKWEQKADGYFTYSFTVPANTTATLYIPKYTNGTAIYQNDALAKDGEGVASFTEEDDRFVLELQSGSYVFDTRKSSDTRVTTTPDNRPVHIYPNPIARGDALHIDADSPMENASLSVYSSVGSCLAAYPLTDRYSRLALNVTPGLYLLDFRSNNEIVKRTKLIVK